MANINPTQFIQKLFPVSTLTSDEWIALLEEWGKDINWQPDEGEHPLIKWINTRPPFPEVATWLTKHYGQDIWTQSDGKTTALNQLMKGVRSERTMPCLGALLPLLPKDTLHQALDQALNEKDSQGVLGYPLTDWKHHLKMIAYFAANHQNSLAKTYLELYPEALTERQWGYAPSAIMARSSEGWDAYVQAGGSIFDQVYNDPKTGQQTTVGVPLWSWLMQKKVYHEGMRKTLEQLLMRLQEAREPAEGDLVLSDFDWQQLVENKSLLVREMQMIEFEKKIQKDYKQAIKENKHWRKWRSSEGANFMFWLACKKPVEFVRQAYKVRLNEEMIKSKDDLGRGFLPYLLTGMLLEDLGSYRKEEKVRNELWPEMLKVALPWMDLDPKKGFLADWMTSPASSFFGAVGQGARIKHGYRTNHVQEFFKIHPKVLWNGFDGSVMDQMFLNPDVSERAVPLFHVILPSLSQEKWQDIANKMDPNEQLRWLCIQTHGDLIGNLGQNINNFKETLAQLTANPESITLPLDILEKMNAYTGKHLRTWYHAETLKQFQALMEKVTLSAHVKGNEQTPPPMPKRKM